MWADMSRLIVIQTVKHSGEVSIGVSSVYIFFAKYTTRLRLNMNPDKIAPKGTVKSWSIFFAKYTTVLTLSRKQRK